MFLFLVVLAIVLIFYFRYREKYAEYQYFKSQRFLVDQFQVTHHLFDSYLFIFYQNPVNVADYMAFCDTMNRIHFNSPLFGLLTSNRVSFVNDEKTKNTKIVIYPDKRKQCETIKKPDEVSLFEYLYNDVAIEFGELYHAHICTISPKRISILKNKFILDVEEYDSLYRSVGRNVNTCLLHYFGKIPYAKLPDTSSLVIRANVIDSSTISLRLLCDPFMDRKYDYSPLLDSLSASLEKDIEILKDVDSFVFPVAPDTTKLERKRTEK